MADYFLATTKAKQDKSFHGVEVLLIGFNTLSFIAIVFFNIAATIPIGGLFESTTSEILGKHPIGIHPSAWNYDFRTWGVMYGWMALWLLLNILFIFVLNKFGRMHVHPPVFTKQFLLFTISNFMLNISWLFLWDGEHFGISFGVMVLMAGTIWAATVIAHKNVYEALRYLKEANKPKAIRLYYLLLNNGVVYYAAWCTITMAINFSIAWTYEWVENDANVKEDYRQTSSIVAMSVLSTFLVVYFVLEVILLEKYMRYTFSCYIQFIVQFTGILIKVWDSNKTTTSSIFAFVLAGLAAFMLFLKLILTILKSVIRINNKMK